MNTVSAVLYLPLDHVSVMSSLVLLSHQDRGVPDHYEYYCSRGLDLTRDCRS